MTLFGDLLPGLQGRQHGYSAHDILDIPAAGADALADPLTQIVDQACDSCNPFRAATTPIPPSDFIGKSQWNTVDNCCPAIGASPINLFLHPSFQAISASTAHIAEYQ